MRFRTGEEVVYGRLERVLIDVCQLNQVRTTGLDCLHWYLSGLDLYK